MRPAPATVTCRITRLIVLWLLAFVLPLQGAAVGVFSAMGPAHVHQRVEAPLVLEDVRRWRSAPAAKAPAFATAFAWVGHAHAGAAPQRHHHTADDASVVRAEAIGPLDSADTDEALGAGALSVLALIPAVPAWADAAAAADPAARPPWALRTSFIAFPDRPPTRA